ncbi:hypothetical protein OIU85_017145 [Salix viminalis]|uniref:Uncharacterized protein n=1 Tax=Salix viminalis TaxID=40686 RepID=A0A9Q0ZQK7_SALVM|nr:hypothetical protein OIU85_017145 [Salix viminalis]
MKKSKELKRKVDTKQERKKPLQCNPDKSVSFQRLWSFEDEIVLLKCIKIFEKVEIPPDKQNLYDLSKLIWKEKAEGSNEVVAKEVKVSDNDEAITKKLNALESYFEMDDKETKMKKYFVTGLTSFRGIRKKRNDREVLAVVSLQDEFGWEAE